MPTATSKSSKSLTYNNEKLVLSPMSNTPTLDQLQRGLAISEQIAALEAELAAIFGDASTPVKESTPASAPTPKKKGSMSAEGRARIVAAQKERWAKIKTISPLDTLEIASSKPAKKRTMSAAHKAKMKKAAQARWARIKAGKEASPFKK